MFWHKLYQFYIQRLQATLFEWWWAHSPWRSVQETKPSEWYGTVKSYVLMSLLPQWLTVCFIKLLEFFTTLSWLLSSSSPKRILCIWSNICEQMWMHGMTANALYHHSIRCMSVVLNSCQCLVVSGWAKAHQQKATKQAEHQLEEQAHVGELIVVEDWGE